MSTVNANLDGANKSGRPSNIAFPDSPWPLGPAQRAPSVHPLSSSRANLRPLAASKKKKKSSKKKANGPSQPDTVSAEQPNGVRRHAADEDDEVDEKEAQPTVSISRHRLGLSVA